MGRALFQSKKPLFWEQIRRGLLPGDAGVAVGVSASCGRRWFGEAGGVKPCVSKSNTAGLRPRLTLEDRIEIQAGVHANESLRSIGRRIGRPASTIKREIDNNNELQSERTTPAHRGTGASTPSGLDRAADRPRCNTARWPPTIGPLTVHGGPRAACWPAMTCCVMRCRVDCSCGTALSRSP